MDRANLNGSKLSKADLIVVTGAGGFIGGNLVKYFHDKGFSRIRAVDKKPFREWYLQIPDAENVCLDCSNEEACKRACEGATEVYNLAADMGGMGFIERFRVECLRSILINTHMIEAAYWGGGAAVLLLLFSLCIQHSPSAGSERSCAQGIRRIPSDGREGLWLGKAYVRDVLPGVLR